MSKEIELSIANLSNLSKEKYFLLQVSKKSKKLLDFLKNQIPKNDKEWLADFESWKINNKWIKQVSDICISEFDQVFYDFGENLYDLKVEKDYDNFKNLIDKKLLKKSAPPAGDISKNINREISDSNNSGQSQHQSQMQNQNLNQSQSQSKGQNKNQSQTQSQSQKKAKDQDQAKDKDKNKNQKKTKT